MWFYIKIRQNQQFAFVVMRGDSQLVTQSTRHRSTRHLVDSSHGQLVTKRRSTRHKQTNKQTTKLYCRSSIIIPLPVVRDRRRYEKMHKKLSRKQSEQQSTRSV